jgi:hypothetical protein
MSPTLQHHARITWSDAQVSRGLPTFSETTDPANFEDMASGIDVAWSLVCAFDSPPSEQGNPSAARVHFWISDAPHELLVRGTRLRMFERGTRDYALVEILD